jgi:hypothetical protein
MKITTFKNKKGLIHGHDPKRVTCDKDGLLKIGQTEIAIKAGTEEVLPILINGGTGTHKAVFTDANGTVYHLERVEIQAGRICPPSNGAMELMELRCRADVAEQKCERLMDEIRDLRNIFDTNSLNFLIK